MFEDNFVGGAKGDDLLEELFAQGFELGLFLRICSEEGVGRGVEVVAEEVLRGLLFAGLGAGPVDFFALWMLARICDLDAMGILM